MPNVGTEGADGSGVWGGYPLSSGDGSGAQENFSILSFEMLNCYAFRTLEQGYSTATVIMMLHHILYF